jgi:hypothetical protein
MFPDAKDSILCAGLLSVATLSWATIPTLQTTLAPRGLRVPIIYFLGIAPGRYQAILPAFIGGWDRHSKRAHITFGLPGQTSLRLLRRKSNADTLCRPSSNVFIRRPFEKLLLAAYRGRCALSGFPESMLLDAAHSRSRDMSCLDSPWSATVSRSRKSTTRPSTLISSESTRNSDCMLQSVCSFNMTVQCQRRSRG